MRTVFTFLLLVFFSTKSLTAQENFSTQPWESQFVTEDVDRFWEAFDQMEAKGAQAFQEYIDAGTPGLKGFIDYRIINADSLYSMVQRRKADYLAKKNVLKDLPLYKKRIQAIYAAMKFWYPEAKFPPVYFVMGRFNSGGTISESGIILGAEMQSDLKGLPGLVAHELIHFQQKYTQDRQPTLLEHSLHEGTADFIGELISGEHINSSASTYGKRYRDRLSKEFVLLMEGTDFSNWLYGNINRNDGRPNDLGYWMGYCLAKAYFDKKEDKLNALKTLLDYKNTAQIVEEGGYLKPYQSIVSKLSEEEKKAIMHWLPKEMEVTIAVQAPAGTETVFIAGNHPNLGNWDAGKVSMQAQGNNRFAITVKTFENANFKFTKGYWAGEARVRDNPNYNNLMLDGKSKH